MVTRLNLSRSQIAQIVGNDPEAIRQFEKLFAQGDSNTTSFDDVTLLAGGAGSKASEAIDRAEALADVASLAALAPGPQEHTKRNAYGWFYDTTDQTAAAINTAYAMTFNTTGLAQDVSRGTPTSRIVVARRGIYNIQFSAQFVNVGGSAHRAWVWLRVNGANIPDSATVLRMQGNTTEQVAAWNFIANLNANDYFELMWEVSDTGISLFADPATGVHPAIPSVLLSVTDNISE